MAKSNQFDESCMAKACEAARAQEKPNLSKIAREHGVPYTTLRDRVKNGRGPRTARKPVNKTFKEHQEEALIQWLASMRERNMPVTSKLLEEHANRELQRAGGTKRVSKMWVYRFEKRLPEHLKLAPVIPGPPRQRTQWRVGRHGCVCHGYPEASGPAKALVDRRKAEQPLKLYGGWFCP
jgi:transposase-like protein